MGMKKVGRRVVLGMGLLGGAATGGAEDVGCCHVACHQTDGAGRTMGSVRLTPLAEADCHAQFPGCDVSWTDAPCPDRPGVPADPSTLER
jgi:hypothetical protein